MCLTADVGSGVLSKSRSRACKTHPGLKRDDSLVTMASSLEEDVTVSGWSWMLWSVSVQVGS